MKKTPLNTIARNRKYVQQISLCGLLTALMLVLGYLESRIPLVPAMPGIKLGLSNAVLLYAVYWLPASIGVALMLVKVLLSALLFGSPMALAFSLAGGALSLAGMMAARRWGPFGVVGISVLGAVLHNAGQLAVAVRLVGNVNLLYYGIVLMLAGIATGIVTGIVAGLVMKATGGKASFGGRR